MQLEDYCMNYTFRIIEKNEILIIKELWKKLNEIHLKNSHYFKEHYETFTFEKRCEKFDMINSENIRIEIIEDDKTTIGYCISTIQKSTGEIDSIYVKEEYRGTGLGSSLIDHSLNWFHTKKCDKIIIAVAEGNESAYPFYKKFDFYPRLTYLQQKKG